MKFNRDKMTITDTYGRLVDTEKGITCGCGDSKLTKTMHVDAVSYYSTTYECSCGNTIEVYVER